MTSAVSRRGVLAGAGVATLTGVAGCLGVVQEGDEFDEDTSDSATGTGGAPSDEGETDELDEPTRETADLGGIEYDQVAEITREAIEDDLGGRVDDVNLDYDDHFNLTYLTSGGRLSTIRDEIAFVSGIYLAYVDNGLFHEDHQLNCWILDAEERLVCYFSVVYELARDFLAGRMTWESFYRYVDETVEVGDYYTDGRCHIKLCW